MWIYSQSSGHLWDSRGVHIATGYSGLGEGKNAPKFEAVRNVGPIPRGLWVMGEAYHSDQLGPLAIPLYESGHNALERTYFRIHGDSAAHPGKASKGCVIQGRAIRERMIASGDRLFQVIE